MSKITLLIIPLALASYGLAMEQKHTESIIYVVNDTKDPIRLTADGKKIDPPLAAGEKYAIDPKVSNLTVKYMGSLDISAKSIGIKEIASQAQANDLLIHIIPATTYGVTIGKIEPRSHQRAIETQADEKAAQREYYGLGESLLSVGLSGAEEQAYKLLGVRPGATDHEILGVQQSATPEEIKAAYNSKSKQLYEVPEKSKEVIRAYQRIISTANHNLGGWFQPVGKLI